MCGRYAVTSSPEAIRALFRFEEQPDFPARYNVAPTQPIAIVRLQNGKRHFALVRWGFVPSWVKDPRTFSLLVNARGETVLDKPAYRAAMRYRRCLIPADGFYEWTRAGKGKQPYFIRAKSGAPLALAGLWECWTGPNGEEVETAVVITTRANQTVAALHDRMPVIVPEDAHELWLDCTRVDAATAAALIAPAANDLLEAYPVTTAVNRTANDGPQLIEPFTGEQAKAPPGAARRKKDSRQPTLF